MAGNIVKNIIIMKMIPNFYFATVNIIIIQKIVQHVKQVTIGMVVNVSNVKVNVN